MSGWAIAELVVLGIVVFDAAVVVSLLVFRRWFRSHPYNPRPIFNPVPRAPRRDGDR